MRDPSSTSSSDGRRLAGKAALLAGPFLLAALGELALPPDAFTWRVVEAVKAVRVRAWPGMAYPGLRLARPDEIGELAGPTRLARRRPVVWVTDERGFRHDPASCPGRDYAAALVGDSNLWASVLTQDDLPSARLAKALGACVYPYSPFDMNRFLSDPAWARTPPVVVYVTAQGAVGGLPEPQRDPPPAPPAWTRPLPARALIALDRVLKFPLLRFAQAELTRRTERAYRRLVLGYTGDRVEPLGFSRPGRDGSTLFSAHELAAIPPDDARLADAARKLGVWSRALAARGSRFIYLPVPAKSSVLHRLAGREPDLTLTRLGPFLAREGVEYLDLWPEFRDAAARGESLYEPDDNHWGPAGVARAMDRLAARLRAGRPGTASRPRAPPRS
ncbi:MAG: hypothetical protein SF051_08145 [Elusimicrobiota bacterium]|nr:hypothetical protein [Elusimicrobiota bacterium]